MTHPATDASDRPAGDLRLSVLDLASVGAGQTVADALRATTELAVQTERWGYHRFWVAEHHGIPAVASSSPPVLLAHLAAATDTIRLGSGGVMLPNHAPLVVAEQFGTLAALHPDRIDLGLGRAPGSDQVTSFALRRLSVDPDQDMADRLAELRHFLAGDFPADHPFSRIKAGPFPAVPIWLLGSSDYSARLAGRLGLPFAFAHHFAGAGGATGAALDVYRSSFRPSSAPDGLAEPYAMIGVTALAADTEDEARYQAGAGALSMLLLRSGRLERTPTPEQAAAYPYSPAERDLLAAMGTTEVVGDADQVAEGLRALAARYGVQELMITSRVHGPEVRRRSYELVAQRFGMTPAKDPADDLVPLPAVS
ncbi:LLM class flavin-dependent oxidoreductase [Nakamurella endophytica]|uniref:LLM class flavin-dependent oxidoreductase n=1 Tax=Nakamurella endophytica TaxID=1748367 RepID=UPI001663DAC6|nr:LLM class flavin-dependent oxidoreductase [Nakamurella endophytica]